VYNSELTPLYILIIILIFYLVIIKVLKAFKNIEFIVKNKL